MKKNLVLIGGGGHCKSCIDVIEATEQFNILGILDHKSKIGSELLGYKYIGCDEDIAKYKKKDALFLITVGQIESANLRKHLFKNVVISPEKLATVISPRAYVSKWARIGVGTIIMHDVLINAAAVIGENCIVNTKALIEHDCDIGSHCHISTGAIINGNVSISEGSFFGSNAVSVQSVSVAPSSFIKAGSCFKGDS
jgi:sugar O-acyltransferase (sialic acid O-acetyltransferase NeuD family)